MSKKLAKKVLLIGWDAADWKVIHPLIDSGKMPALEKLINTGVMGNLATLDPPLSPMLWTSIATGKTADKHGILGFTQPDPEGKQIRPVLSTSRKVKAIWNILMQEGYKTNVVGWWPSHPAEPVNGVYVSNFYHKLDKIPLHAPRKFAQDSIHPKRIEKMLMSLRVHPGDLTYAHLLPFVPDAASVDQDKDRRLNSVAKIIAEAATVHAAATWIMENEEWDFMAVYYDAIDHFSHGFMNFHPPRMKGIHKKMFERYKGVTNAGYMFHDMMLERLIELAGPDTTIILISDHGFHSDHLRPRGIPKEPAGPAVQHRPYGIICMNGPHIQRDELIFGSTLLDITPTILTLFGLPVARDMDGKPLIQAFDEPIKLDTIKSWEEVAGECGMHPSDKRQDPWAEQDALDQLIALGYIEPPDENAQKAIDRTVNESKFYLARVFMHSRKMKDALPILEELYENFPEEQRYALRLAQCYVELNRTADAKKIVDETVKKAKKRTPSIDLLYGRLFLAEGNMERAIESLKNAEQANSRLPGLYQHLGQAYLRMERWKDAEQAFIKAISIDRDNSLSHYGIGLAYLRQDKYLEAADEILTAVGLTYFFPSAHYYLGETLVHLGYYDHAAEAFEVCVAQSPGIKKAHLWLIDLYKKHLNKSEKAEEHERFIVEKIKSEEKKQRKRKK